MPPKSTLSKLVNRFRHGKKDTNLPTSTSHSSPNLSVPSPQDADGLRSTSTTNLAIPSGEASTSVTESGNPHASVADTILTAPSSVAAVGSPPSGAIPPTAQAEEELARKTEFRATALEAFKTMLDLGSAAAQAEPVGIAKSVFDSIKYITGMIEKTRNNAETLKEMEKELGNLRTKIQAPLDPDEASPELVAHVDELIKEIELIFKESENPGRWKGQNVILRDRDAAKLTSIAQKIREALDNFIVTSAIRQEQKLHRVVKSVNRAERATISQIERDLLDRLRPVDQAAYDSSRVDEGISTCMEGTRVEVLKEIEAWYNNDSPDASPFFWLNGMAGLGKSTIAKTIATLARLAGRLGASFFISRRSADARLRDPTAVIPTIAYQLAEFSDLHKAAIVEGLQKHRDAAGLKIENQAQFLLWNPLGSLETHIAVPLVVIDAFDELEGTGSDRLLQVLLSGVFGASRIPLKVLITSRPETYIQKSFRPFESSSRLFLHNIEDTIVEGDIRLYLEASLRRIPEDLDLSYPSTWFQPTQMDQLVHNSGKLFVYAATAVRFIWNDPPANPKGQLEKVLTNHGRSSSVFSDLDTLYLEILAKVAKSSSEFVKQFQSLMGTIILLRDFLSVGSLIMAPPTSSGNIKFYHPSFPEFLMDNTRCTNQHLYIDPSKYERELTLRCLTIISRSEQPINEATQISEELQYSCVYWADHLRKCPGGDSRLIEELTYFANYNFLRWLDVVAVKGLMSNAVGVLWDAKLWAVNSECPSKLVGLLDDCWRFVSGFSDHIRAGARYIRQSALPFCPRESQLWKVYAEQTCIKILTGFPSQWSSLLSTLSGHTSRVTVVAFSPDGSRLATGSDDGTVRLWNVGSGAQVGTLKGPTNSVSILMFSPDGLQLATRSSDAKVRLWDVASGVEVATLQGHYESMFLFDGSRLATVSWDATLRLWDVASAAEVTTLEIHPQSVHTVAFSSDGSRVAMWSLDETVRIWDVASGADSEVITLEGQTKLTNVIMFSPNGSRLAATAWDNMIRVWDVQSGAEVATLKGPSKSVSISIVMFSPDGSRLATRSSDAKVRLWEIASATEVTTLEGHVESVEALAFSPSGSRLAIGLSDETVRLWDVASGTEVAVLEGHTGSVRAVKFSPDGSRLATGSSDSTVRLWDTATAAEVTALEDHTKSACSVVFSSDGSRLAMWSLDETVRIWDVASGAEVSILKDRTGSVRTLLFSPNGSRLAMGSTDATVCLWDIASGAKMATLEGHTGSVNTLTFSPDGSRFAMGLLDKTVRLWDVASGVEIATLKGHTGSVDILMFSIDGSRLVTGSWDEVHLWDVASGTNVAKLEGHTGSIDILIFSPYGSRVVTGSRYEIRLWDTASGAKVANLEGRGGFVDILMFSPDGSRLVIGSRIEITVWDVASGANVASLHDHTERVDIVMFSPDSSRLVTGSWNEVWVWDVASGAKVARFEGRGGFADILMFSPDGSQLVTGSSDGMVQLWRVKSGAWEMPTPKGHAGSVITLTFVPTGLQLMGRKNINMVLMWGESENFLPHGASRIAPLALKSGLDLHCSIQDGWLFAGLGSRNVKKICQLPVEMGALQSSDLVTSRCHVAIGSRSGQRLLLDLRGLFGQVGGPQLD